MPERHRIGKSARGAMVHVEEIVLASSGADPFELVFALVAARFAGKSGAPVRARVAAARARYPELGVAEALGAPDEVVRRVDALLDRVVAAIGDEGEALDPLFEQLVARAGKAEKGQFFTPRHVVDFAVRALGLRAGERVVDPACGSGAFLAHARAQADVETIGVDVDPRALRVARLLALATANANTNTNTNATTTANATTTRRPSRAARFACADALDRAAPAAWGPTSRRGGVDAIATNPPFAGLARSDGYALAHLVRRPERDALFVERCLEILRPGGRLAIVLPHNKVAARAWAPLRRFLVERARVFAVISLPHRVFAPYTSQRTVLIVARKRRVPAAPSPGERVFLAVSDRGGKDRSGDPLLRDGASASSGWRAVDHDLAPIARRLGAFLETERFVD